MDMDEKVRENRIRRMLKRQGFELRKSRRRDPLAYDFGGYLVVDLRNRIVFGSDPMPFSATLDEVEEWANLPLERE